MTDWTTRKKAQRYSEEWINESQWRRKWLERSTKPHTEGRFLTDVKAVPGIVAKLRANFLSGVTLDVSFRLRQLHQLYKLLDENEEDFVEAFRIHLGRPKGAAVFELEACKADIAKLMNNLEEWVKPKHVRTDEETGDSGYFHYTPRGVATIIGPWNYPIACTITPFAGAIAAGCTAVMKPSEVNEAMSDLLAELVPDYLDTDYYDIVTGGIPQSQALLKERVDLIFLTGGCEIGKIAMRAAAEHLTPVVLELGGKNPVIVDDTVDLDMVAERVMYGRLTNGGQICIAPEYVIIPRPLQDDFIDACQRQIRKVFTANPAACASYGKIVSDRHFDRVQKVLEENKEFIAVGGGVDRDARYVEPTILRDVDENTPVMKAETFAPILSVYPVADIREAVPIIARKPKSLALYVFSTDKAFVQDVMARTDAGGVTVNDTLSHVGWEGLPFGGSGASGTGRYFGKETFLAFVHEKPVLYRKVDYPRPMLDFRTPPITDEKLAFAKPSFEKPKRKSYVNKPKL